MMNTPRVAIFLFAMLFTQNYAAAQTLADVLPDSWIQDYNGDGRYDIVAFGDSITRGKGDFIAPNQTVYDVPNLSVKAGYPLRVESLLQINVSNLGLPGEEVTGGALTRFIANVPAIHPDIVIISGGSNDAEHLADSNDYFYTVQTMINIAQANGIKPLLMTVPPTCCGHAALNPFIDSYNSQLSRLSAMNEIGLASTHHAYTNSCDVGSCYLINRPEGLHPNIDGYDVMGEAVIAGLLKMDLFAPDGAAKLESVLSLPAGSVTTKPDPAI